MASSVPAKKNTAFSFPMSLEATAGGSFVTNPTLASGDVKVSKDGGAFANITTLPTAIGAGDVITVSLSAAEMNADSIIVAFRDVAGAEWLPCNAGPIFTAAQTLDEMDTVLDARASQTSVDTIDGIVDAILVDTAEIGAAGAGLTEAGGTGDHLTAINLPDQTMNITGDITGNLSGSVGSVTGLTASDVGAIKAKTDNLPSDPADQSLIIAATDAITTAIAALNDLSAAEVNAEVVDALANDTYAEPGQGAPAATTTLAAKINYLYKALRNKTEVTATEHKIYADNGTTVDHKRTISDDSTTFTSGELGTGA